MPGERYTIEHPERVREWVRQCCEDLGLERADIAAVQRENWKDQFGTWTYDQIMKLDSPSIVHDKLRKLSLILGYESDAIERVDRGEEPLPLPDDREDREEIRAELRELRDRLEEVARIEQRVDDLVRLVAEALGLGVPEARSE